MSNNRRRLSNYLIDRNALARLSVPFAIMASVSLTIVLTVSWKVLQALETTELVGAENLPAMNHLLELQRTVTTIGIWGILTLGAVCLTLWVVFSHRIFGPMIPIRRHLHKLLEGDFSSRVQLRTGDEFQDLARDLNTLAEQLSTQR